MGRKKRAKKQAKAEARRRAAAALVAAPASAIGELVPYDKHLLERARTQWQFGDWQSLAAIDAHALEHHPQRATLRLLAAAGRLQLGPSDTAGSDATWSDATGSDATRSDTAGSDLTRPSVTGPDANTQARALIQAAIEAGAERAAVARTLIAGVHSSLAKASALAGKPQARVLGHVEQALRVGSPGADVRLLTLPSAARQLSQLGQAAGLEQVALPHWSDWPDWPGTAAGRAEGAQSQQN